MKIIEWTHRHFIIEYDNSMIYFDGEALANGFLIYYNSGRRLTGKPLSEDEKEDFIRQLLREYDHPEILVFDEGPFSQYIDGDKQTIKRISVLSRGQAFVWVNKCSFERIDFPAKFEAIAGLKKLFEEVSSEYQSLIINSLDGLVDAEQKRTQFVRKLNEMIAILNDLSVGSFDMEFDAHGIDMMKRYSYKLVDGKFVR
jgi:hydroxymethylpyrimidine pyrophosphatase-like HAD family hydrolase